MKRCLLFVGLCLAATGCSATGDVKGTVSYKGANLKHGTVTAISSGGPMQAQISDSGAYELKAVPVGKVKFYVVCQDPKLSDILSEAAKKGKEALEAGGDAKKKEGGGRMPAIANVANASLIPEKYGDHKQELLTFDVVKGENTYNIDLKP